MLECKTEFSLSSSGILSMEIVDIYIKNYYQNNGYGKKLVEQVLAYAEQNRIKRIFGERSERDTNTMEKYNRWYHFWIEHFGCQVTESGFVKHIS